jgi:4-aminobutyrate aminotransferase
MMDELIRPDVKTVIPGENAKKLIAMDDKYMMTCTKTSPLAIKKGQGIVLEDVDGNLFYDFTSGVGVCNTGHCHPKVVKAIHEQSTKLLHFAGTDYYYEPQSMLLEKIAHIGPGNHDKRVFFTNSGAESVEAAIKLSRFATKRTGFMAFLGAFHGRTMGALSLTCSKQVHKKGFAPTMPGAHHVPFAYCYRCPYHLKYPSCDIYCADAIEENYFSRLVHPEDIAAFFVEPIQGEGGYVVPPKEFMQKIKKLCEKYGILFVSDEIQAGFGRTGKFFGIEHFDIVPDIITMAKGMGSGLPIGCIQFDAKLNYPYEGAHSNTFGGNPVCCSASLATIEILTKDGLIQNAADVGQYFHDGLKDLQKKHPVIGDVRGIGLMQGIEIVKDPVSKEKAPGLRNAIIDEGINKGLITIGCGTNSIRFIPPLVIRKQEIDIALNILDQAIHEASKNQY